MNKKGFMFVETIVTLTVLMALLITIYTIFVNLLQKEKTTAEYDSYGDKYALFYIREYNDNFDFVGKAGSKVTSSDITYLFGLESLVVATCNGRTVVDDISSDFQNYIDQLPNCDNGQVKITGEFKVENTYSYAHIIYPNI